MSGMRSALVATMALAIVPTGNVALAGDFIARHHPGRHRRREKGVRDAGLAKRLYARHYCL
jgi:hypothetical protein